MTAPTHGRNTEAETAWRTALDHAANCPDCRPPSEGCETGLALLQAHHEAWTKLREQPHPRPRKHSGPHTDPNQRRTKPLGDIAYGIGLAALIAFPALLLMYTYTHH